MKFKGGCHCGSVAKEIVPARYGFRDVAGHRGAAGRTAAGGRVTDLKRPFVCAMPRPAADPKRVHRGRDSEPQSGHAQMTRVC